MLKPKKLQPGDKIGLISASAPLAGLLPSRKKRGVEVIKKLGFQPIIGANAELVTGYTAGSAKSRADDFNDFVSSTDVKAIISFIGLSERLIMITRLEWFTLHLNGRRKYWIGLNFKIIARERCRRMMVGNALDQGKLGGL